MYLWKYWRESRIAFSVALLVIIGTFLNTFRERVHSVPDVRQLSTLLALLLYFQMVPLGFLGWLMGSIGAGRDLGEKNGSFLFTRPRRRGYFVWSDWACGLAQLLPLVMLSNFVVWFQIHRLLLMTGDPWYGVWPNPLHERNDIFAHGHRQPLMHHRLSAGRTGLQPDIFFDRCLQTCTGHHLCCRRFDRLSHPGDAHQALLACYPYAGPFPAAIHLCQRTGL